MKALKDILLVFTAILILLPSAVNFSHIFLGHGHVSCNNYAEYHYHSDSLDCDLHKYHKKPTLHLDFPKYVIIPQLQEKRSPQEYYQFLNDYEAIGFDLRGPPVHT